MRVLFCVIFASLIVALGSCAHIAGTSRKTIGKAVRYMLLALIPPIIGNLIIIASTNRLLSLLGSYIYFVGMDFAMLALLHFTGVYCTIEWPRKIRLIILTIVGIDILQLLANTIFGHAFALEEITAYGVPYFRLVPLLGQTFHRVVDYGILAAVLVVFLIKTIRSPRINSERYSVILATIVFTSAWETIYIFSRTPVDRSMIGFGVFGLLVFFFSLYYRPLRLLDSMLATVASEIPDALFFFDVNDHCIWVNKHGGELVGCSNLDLVPQCLESLLGSIGKGNESWNDQRIIGSGEKIRSYVIERRVVKDDRERNIGSFLSVRDNTNDQKLLRQEIYNATHDALTELYNRAGYELLLANLKMESTTMLIIDVDAFKHVNDHYGHETGDHVLQKVAKTLIHFFRTEDYICRTGGDEFVILLVHSGEAQIDEIRRRITQINKVLRDGTDGLPPVSVSAGVACGDNTTGATELFNRADQALYETKRNGKCGMTFWVNRVERIV